jgi:hypothetical protein
MAEVKVVRRKRGVHARGTRMYSHTNMDGNCKAEAVSATKKTGREKARRRLIGLLRKPSRRDLAACWTRRYPAALPKTVKTTVNSAMLNGVRSGSCRKPTKPYVTISVKRNESRKWGMEMEVLIRFAQAEREGNPSNRIRLMAAAGAKVRKKRSISEGKSERWKKVDARKRLTRRPVNTLKRTRENFIPPL